MNLNSPIDDVIPSVDGRVLVVLARSGLALTGARIASFASASKERVRQVLAGMVDAGLVVSQPAGQAILYEANRKHLLWPAIEQLVADSDQIVYLVKLQIIKLLEGLIDDVAIAEQCTLALYGSVARGDAGAESDIDILLITPDELDPATVDRLVSAITDSVAVGTGNECNVYASARSNFDQLLVDDDPMVASWNADALVFHGPNFRRRLKGLPWDER